MTNLNLIVCIKQVPDPKWVSEVTIDPDTKRLQREKVKVPMVINSEDENAIEEALRVKEMLNERAAITVTVISMGPLQAMSALRKALAMGVDDAVLLSDEAFSGADTLATAYTLAKGIERICKPDAGTNMILCGNETIDSGTSQVPPQLAEFLCIPHVTHVREIEQVDVGVSMVKVKRQIEGGYLRIKLKMAAVLAVLKEINQPRYPTALGIMESTKKEIKVWNAKDIGAESDKIGLPGSPTKMTEFFTECGMKNGRKGKILKVNVKGDGEGEGGSRSEEVVREAIGTLEELGVEFNK